MPELTPHDRAILDFEREWWQYAGDKATAVRNRFNLELDTYHQKLNQLIATDAAYAHDRMLIKRLRRLAAQRRRRETSSA